MRVSVFSKTAALAYIFSMLFVISRILMAADTLKPKSGINETIDRLYSIELAPWFFLSIVIIGFRFYWHAENVDRHENFIESYSFKKEKIIRFFWVAPALFIPLIFNSFNLENDTHAFMSHWFFILTLLLMYVAMSIWQSIYLNEWIDCLHENQRTSLNKDNKNWLRTLDFVVLSFLFAIIILLGFLTYLDHQLALSLYLLFLIVALSFASIIIFVQILLFYGLRIKKIFKSQV